MSAFKRKASFIAFATLSGDIFFSTNALVQSVDISVVKITPEL